jgi:hypothetical protein
VSELAFILTDVFLSGRVEARAAGSDSLPRLPALETVLARARRHALPAGWRGWLAERVGERPLPPAERVAAMQGCAEPTRGHWLATPVHLFAGLDSVHVHPAGLLRLGDAEQQQLVSEFAAVFADSPWRLQALGERELLLSGPPLRASADDPAVVLGQEPTAAMPRGPDATALRRLGSELELWLHEHPVNLERQQRGELPVTTFWLWGARSDAASDSELAQAMRAPSDLVQPSVLPQLIGCDTYANALWRAHAADRAPLPRDASELGAALFTGRGSIVLYAPDNAGGLAALLTQLEQHWLRGALAALRARRIHTLWLLTGAHAYQLGWLGLLRVWRPREPWWRGLS